MLMNQDMDKYKGLLKEYGQKIPQDSFIQKHLKYLNMQRNFWEVEIAQHKITLPTSEKLKNLSIPVQFLYGLANAKTQFDEAVFYKPLKKDK